MDNLFGLKSKIALITGGAGYLGRHMVAALAEAGAHVVIADAMLDLANEVAQDQRSRQLLVDAVEYDAVSEESIRAMVSQAHASYGGIDILVNSAYKFIEHRIDEATAKDFDETLKIGVTGYFLVSQAGRNHETQKVGLYYKYCKHVWNGRQLSRCLQGFAGLHFAELSCGQGSDCSDDPLYVCLLGRA